MTYEEFLHPKDRRNDWLPFLSEWWPLATWAVAMETHHWWHEPWTPQGCVPKLEANKKSIWSPKFQSNHFQMILGSPILRRIHITGLPLGPPPLKTHHWTISFSFLFWCITNPMVTWSLRSTLSITHTPWSELKGHPSRRCTQVYWYG